MDCGPTCLRMVAKYHGRNFKVQTLRQLCEISKEGVSLLGISDASEKNWLLLNQLAQNGSSRHYAKILPNGNRLPD